MSNIIILILMIGSMREQMQMQRRLLNNIVPSPVCKENPFYVGQQGRADRGGINQPTPWRRPLLRDDVASAHASPAAVLVHQVKE